MSASPAPARCTMRGLSLVKQGNREAEYEDAYSGDPERGVAAVADGASEGIFSRLWALLLVDSFVRRLPDLGDPEALAEWLQACRGKWLRQLNYRRLRYTQQIKVDRTGAAATFLGWQLGSAGEDESVPFRAWAVGDSCLFWVRDNRLRASFPVERHTDFGLTPALLRTREDAPQPSPQCLEGCCRPADLFVLATDAMAQLLLRSAEEQEPDWDELETIDEPAWREQIAALRAEQRIVNDDCTVLTVRIGASPVQGL